MRLIASIGVAAVLLTGWPATAFAASPAPTAAELDGATVAHAFLIAGDFGAVIRKTVAGSFNADGMDFPREEWKGLFKRSLEEEFNRHLPEL